MALDFTTKIKKDMLNAWKDSDDIYVCALEAGNPRGKLDCKKITFPTTNNNKLVYNSPINLNIPENKTVVALVLTTNIEADQAIAENGLANEIITDGTFQYGGTFRVNEIEIELT